MNSKLNLLGVCRTRKKTDTPRRNICNYEMHHLFPSHDVLPTNLGSTTKFQAWKFSKGLQSKTPGKKVGTFSGGQIKRWTLRCCIPCKRSEELPRFPAKYDPFLVTLPHLWRFFAPGILLKPRVAAKRIAGVLSWNSRQSAAFQTLNESSRTPKDKTPVLSWNFHGFFLIQNRKKIHPTTPVSPPPASCRGSFCSTEAMHHRAPWPDPIAPWWPRPESTATPEGTAQQCFHPFVPLKPYNGAL